MKFICTILVTLMIFGCTKQLDKESPEINAVKINEKFYINLPENHQTGYMWQLSNSYDTKKLNYITSVFHGNEKGVYFYFEGLKKGKTTLDFTLIKYRDTTEVKSFIIEIE